MGQISSYQHEKFSGVVHHMLPLYKKVWCFFVCHAFGIKEFVN